MLMSASAREAYWRVLAFPARSRIAPPPLVARPEENHSGMSISRDLVRHTGERRSFAVAHGARRSQAANRDENDPIRSANQRRLTSPRRSDARPRQGFTRVPCDGRGILS